ncbi:hypothetical protein B0H67DRAFT_593016 [Lasiosphaeris hirsuta]|uniref:Uncharacterized protein n=1 Tax=Lasiosphaeris hirsuta TaxID=260670 RepID=A0AA39ZWP4_9PEZI|nr:hypothetical protein B0H67DRAFT_593016 [Lasiosphaeris hirsuta]
MYLPFLRLTIFFLPSWMAAVGIRGQEAVYRWSGLIWRFGGVFMGGKTGQGFLAIMIQNSGEAALVIAG